MHLLDISVRPISGRMHLNGVGHERGRLGQLGLRVIGGASLVATLPWARSPGRVGAELAEPAALSTQRAQTARRAEQAARLTTFASQKLKARATQRAPLAFVEERTANIGG
jgi:hypothetical protein